MPGAGIFKKLFHKDKKPLNTQRVVISNTQKYGFQEEAEDSLNKPINLEPVDFTNFDDGPFLEDTPAEGIVFDKSSSKSKHREKKSKEKFTEKPVTFNTKSTEKPVVFNAKTAEKRFKKNRKSLFDIFSGIPAVFKKKPKTSNSSALEFAGNNKRMSRKDKRNRRIFVYAGTGVIAAILTLVIVLVPGQAAPAGGQTPGASQTLTQGPVFAVDNTGAATSGTAKTGVDVSESPATMPSVSPTPTRTAIPTTPPDVTTPVIDLDEEVKTFMVKADKYYNKMGYSNNHYKYTPEEYKMLAQVIWAEARGERFEGQIAVGNVIMNRVLNKSKFGNTIESVVTASNQFAYPSAYNPNLPTSLSSRRAAIQVLDYENWVIPQNVYYFRVSRSTDYWHGTYLKNIDHHAFYAANYSGRSKVKSVPPAMFERTYKWPTIGCKPEMRVYKLQYMLNKLGYDVKADKYFGQDTKDAIKDFQKKHKMEDDGIAGEGTLKALIKEFGYDKYYEAFYENN